MNFFLELSILKMDKRNQRVITKIHAADPEKGFLTKSISKPYGRATDMPPAWQLIVTANFSQMFKMQKINEKNHSNRFQSPQNSRSR